MPFSSIVSTLNPYVLYIKIAAIVILVSLLIGFGIYFKGLQADVAKYKLESETKQQQLEAKTKELENLVILNKNIEKAIKSIRITVNNEIQRIDNEPAPQAPVDNASIPFIPAGLSVFQNMSAM